MIKGLMLLESAKNGITTVKEVIQVKRNITSNVTRPILDALRGSLHRFDAFQGTIITLSGLCKKEQRRRLLKKGQRLLPLLMEINLLIF